MVQLKASDNVNIRSDGSIACRVERKHLTSWLAQRMPVILILYDAMRDCAYWLYVQSYFREHGRSKVFATTTLPIPANNIVDPHAMMRLARFLRRALKQIGEVHHDENEDKNDPL